MPWNSESQIKIFKVRNFDILLKIENVNIFTQKGGFNS